MGPRGNTETPVSNNLTASHNTEDGRMLFLMCLVLTCLLLQRFDTHLEDDIKINVKLTMNRKTAPIDRKNIINFSYFTAVFYLYSLTLGGGTDR